MTDPEGLLGHSIHMSGGVSFVGREFWINFLLGLEEGGSHPRASRTESATDRHFLQRFACPQIAETTLESSQGPNLL